MGANRDDAPASGGATMYSHSLYLQMNTSAVIRRNVFTDPAATGASVRGDVRVSENVFIDNPIGIAAGLGDNYNVERPSGVLIDVGHNLFLGDADINSSNPRGIAINSGNGKPGSATHDNVMIRSRNPYAVNVTAFNNHAMFNQPSYMLFSDNLVYKFSPVISGNGGHYPWQVFSTFTNNAWDAPASGTNISSAGVYFPNPITAADMFYMLGCSDKATCISQMVTSPDANWGPRMRQMMFAAYGRG